MAADPRQVQRESALVAEDIERAAGSSQASGPAGGGGVVGALVEKRARLLARLSVVEELEAVDAKRSAGQGRGGIARPQGGERGSREALQLAHARVGALENSGRVEFLAQSTGANSAHCGRVQPPS